MKTGDIIDQRFLLKEICSSRGGMGEIFFVDDVTQHYNFRLVLKYCKKNDQENIRRFKREVSILKNFQGNDKVVQIIAANIEHIPPYFIMRYYPDGDLDSQRFWITGDPKIQERIFCNMIDCINELHTRNVFHRDIKPQNFLLNNNSVVVSDVGLSLNIDSNTTTLTSTTEVWHTLGYCPPEFYVGHFKDPDAASDIFMLGKTFYNILTGRDPFLLSPDGIPSGIFHVIERACHLEKERRYQQLSELKQALVGAYDIILNRIDGLNDSRIQLDAIMSQLQVNRQYYVDNVTRFIESIGRLNEDHADQILQSLVSDFFLIISQNPFDSIRLYFLHLYEKMVDKKNFNWYFAETIANHMNIVFSSPSVQNNEKTFALKIAINGAISQNRFAAMDTCSSMIMSIDHNQKELAECVAAMLMEYPDSFISSMETNGCHSDIIISALLWLKNNQRS